jgi:hypothetical protein
MTAAPMARLGSGYNAAAATANEMACYWEPDMTHMYEEGFRIGLRP